MINNICKDIIHKHHQIMKICINKDVEELTDEERFSICFTSGVDMKYELWDNKINMTTKYECGIIKIDGRFAVIELKND